MRVWMGTQVSRSNEKPDWSIEFSSGLRKGRGQNDGHGKEKNLERTVTRRTASADSMRIPHFPSLST